MTDKTRPSMVAYVHAHLLVTEAELTKQKKVFARFAEREGYALARIYIEQAHTAPAAFTALLEAIEREGTKAVAVPSMTHLTTLGGATNWKHHIRYTTGARVLIAGSPP